MKFGLAPGQATRLRRHLRTRGLESRRQTLETTYFDTPDFALQRQRIALRLRQAGRRWLQTLKAEAPGNGMLSQRPEWEVALPGPQLDLAALPAEARARLAGIELGSLQPAFSTRFSREAYHLETDTPEGPAVVEIALDIGRIEAGGRQVPLSEIELELKAGAPAALHAVALALLDHADLHIEPRSKAERGYQLAGATVLAPSPAPPFTMAGPADWPRAVQTEIARFTHHLPGALAGEDPEFNHQLRLALRRLHLCLHLCLHVAGLAGQDIASLRPPLRSLFKALAPLRDLDVLRGTVLPTLARRLNEVNTLQADTLQAVDPPLARQHAAAHQAASRQLATSASTRLILDLQSALCDAPPPRSALKPAARAALARWARQFSRAARHQNLDDPDARHRLRLAAKRLRDGLELFAPLAGKRWQRFAQAQGPALHRLTDRLGREQDLQIAAGLIDAAGLVRSAPYPAGLLLGALHTELAWLRASHSKRLKRAIARICANSPR